MKSSIKTEVELINRYEVEFDTSIINEEWMEHFSHYFYDYSTLEEHAEHISYNVAKFGRNFIEGYGFVLFNGKPPVGVKMDAVNHGINVIHNPIKDEEEHIDIQ